MGTACGNSMYIAFLVDNFSSKGFTTSTGQTSAQSSQPVHLSGSTYLLLRHMFAVKSPGFPSSELISA